MMPELLNLIIDAVEDGEELPYDDLKLIDLFMAEKARRNFFAAH